MRALALILMFGSFAWFRAHFAAATFDDDLKRYIQKLLADSITLTTERISFCHPPPPASGVNKVKPLEQQFNLYFFPDILFWDPLSRIPSIRGVLQCPKEACKGRNSLLRAVGWKDGKTERSNPRRLYGLTTPVVLVSRVYRCQLNNHEVVAHDGHILMQLCKTDRPPFILSHLSGITRDVQTAISSFVLSELTFSGIAKILSQQLWSSLAERCKTLSIHYPTVANLSPSTLDSDIKSMWSTPSNDFIETIFLADFWEKEKLYTARMIKEIGTDGWISMDHTFKVACNIGIKRKSDNKWEKMFDTLFCVLNEKGQVMGWQLTKGTSFENIRGLLQRINSQCESKQQHIKSCYIDNCCSWRSKLQSVFTSSCDVKLDLFHAVSRVVTEMPKRHPFHGACSADFTKVFRVVDDLGPIRKKPTPKSEEILKNLDQFVAKWKNLKFEDRPILTVKAVDEIRKLRKHITKGCLSEIPVGCGSERNENLHKWLRRAVHRNRLSVVLAVALFTTYFYAWNEKRENGSDAIIPPIDCLVNQLSDILSCDSESFGLARSSLSEQNLPRVVLEQYEQNPCSIDTSNVESGDHDTSDMETDNLSKEELLFIIDQAVILYIQYQDLKARGLLSIFNPRFLNLMHQQALFAFDTFHCKDMNFDANASKINLVVSGLGFEILPVPKDGDCLFTSVLLQLEQLLPHADNKELTDHLQMLGLTEKTLPEKVKVLRAKLVDEWLSNKDEYQKFLVDTELEEKAAEFRNNGVFTGELGNMMLLGVSNVLRMPVTVFTAMEHFAIIPVSPRSKPLIGTPIYLSFNHAGPGHYDAVVFQDTFSKNSHEDDTNSVSQQSQETGKLQLSCRCGKGGAKKRSSDGNLKEFCVQIPGERRVSCPCFLSQQGCKNCNCLNCGNYFGKQEQSTSKTELQENGKKRRNREEQFVQKNRVNSLDLISQSSIDLTASTSWCESETLLFEVMLDKLGDQVNNNDVSYLTATYNTLCNLINSNALPFPVNNKTKKQVEGKLKHLRHQAILFREMYMNQVAFNLGMQ